MPKSVYLLGYMLCSVSFGITDKITLDIWLHLIVYFLMINW